QYAFCSAKAGRDPSLFAYRNRLIVLARQHQIRPIAPEDPLRTLGRAPLQASAPSQPPNSPAQQASYPRSRRELLQDCCPVQGLFEAPMLLFVETPPEAVGNTVRSRSLLAQHELEQNPDLFGVLSGNTRSP